jgi:hypothetical protein
MFKAKFMRIILIFLLFFFAKNSFANPYLSVGAVYQKQTDKSFYLKEKILPTASIGYFTNIKNLTATIQTNRISNFVNKEFVQNKKDGKAYELKSRLTSDTMSIGYKFGKFNPAFFISNVKLEKTITKRKINHAIIFGLNLNYFCSKNVSVATAIVAPNDELGLTIAGLLSLNYFF